VVPDTGISCIVVPRNVEQLFKPNEEMLSEMHDGNALEQVIIDCSQEEEGVDEARSPDKDKSAHADNVEMDHESIMETPEAILDFVRALGNKHQHNYCYSILTQ
jgi:hypothetical protein